MLVADKEELLMLLDSNGNTTGNYEKRSVVHKNGLIHREIAFVPINIAGGV